ncbi:TRAF-like superfamily protein [Arabidopsis thaliana]|jgi:E3 ubiquitin-protein ligase SIAH1|uniref:TRAF-like superfamily protein n=1 Tax=Arabidopsis thaliana TaxID=3702 RepID=F4JDF6_ARATH|nr:TRAF-like superfamily protein [Arabidopsis thaliana]AEE75392.2 TRAF-like superfamily protein [Arabidopsis thaliana]|eukprot:NP_001319542.1 TRAF-like superfamily protein [Arabidopsis thaliana]
MEPRINDLQVESRVHELLDFPVHTNQISSAIYECPNDHIENPKKKPYNCPHSGAKCDVTGDIQRLLLHLRNDHNVEMSDGRSFSHRYVHHDPKHLHHATWMLTVSYITDYLALFLQLCEFLSFNPLETMQLLDCCGRKFCLYFEAFHLRKTPMYMAFMQFMGDEEEAMSFSYSLQVGGNGRKLTWQGVPRSIRDSHKTVRDSQDGLIITRKLALFFSTDNNTTDKELKLKVSGRVWREQPVSI